MFKGFLNLISGKEDQEAAKEAADKEAALSDSDYLDLNERSGQRKSNDTPKSRSPRAAPQGSAPSEPQQEIIQQEFVFPSTLCPPANYDVADSQRPKSRSQSWREARMEREKRLELDKQNQKTDDKSDMDNQKEIKVEIQKDNRRDTPTSLKANEQGRQTPRGLFDVSSEVIADMAEFNEVRQKRRGSPLILKRDLPENKEKDNRESEGDGFPWPKRTSGASNDIPAQQKFSSIEMDATSTTMQSDHGRSLERHHIAKHKKKSKRKCCDFPWWHKLVRKMQDKRANELETANSPLWPLDTMKPAHVRLTKRVLNVLFLSGGLVLLLAVIVLIIYTDSQFNESMKALTVFIAGRRQGMW